MTKPYSTIQIGGGDTATPINLRKRLRFMAQCCDLQSAQLLDCGCGAGEYVFALLDSFGTDAWGIEYSETKVQQAKRHPHYAAHVKTGNLQHLAEPDGKYDVALLNEVLEHVPDHQAGLREVRRVLKPGGMLIVFSPNRWYPFETHGVTWRPTGRRLPPYLPFIPYVPIGIGRRVFEYWARNYWPHELRFLIRQTGFVICRTGFLWQTFENISGEQPWVIRRFRPVFRFLADASERIPLLRCFGVSQVVVAKKGGPNLLHPGTG
jgi:ubiquinone/menaquinone biosynthesis C-methylase UbiE